MMNGFLGLSYKGTLVDFTMMTNNELEVVMVNNECGSRVLFTKEQVEALRNFLNEFLDEQR
jgi:histidinol phosphatase-like enzyme